MKLERTPHGWTLTTPTATHHLNWHTTCRHTGGDPCHICWNCSRNLIATPNGPCPTCGEPPCR